MRVLKRDNTYEDVSLYKVQKRIDSLCKGLNVSGIEIAQKVCSRIHDGVKTSTLDDEAARLCAQLITKHPDYGIVAARIAISNHHKKTSPSFSETVNLLYNATDIHNKHNPLISEELYLIVQKHKEKLNTIINYDRDYNYDYFGFKTLERSYLLKINGKIVERPQHMILRVALGIHGWDLKEALETYELMSTRYFTHATPTLFNAGTPRPQLSSCYLIAMEDSITGMYKTLGDCAQISKYAGGIGMHIHDIRATGSYIRGTNGQSTGIVPMLRVYNATGRHVNQCFRGNTIVYGKNGPKQMQDIVIGDELITIDGSLKPVLQICKNNINKEIIKIKPKNAIEPVYVTKEHQIYVISGEDTRTKYSEIFDKLDAKLSFPEYKSAGELIETDFIGYSIPREIIDYNESVEFFRFYGILLSDDGHAIKRKNCNSIEFAITIGHKKNEIFGFVCEFLTQKGIHFWTNKNESTYQIRWIQNREILNITYDDIYDDKKYKRPLAKYLNLPFEKTYSLLKGIFETDKEEGNDIYLYNTSKELIYAIRYLLLRIGVLSSGYIKSNFDSYVLRVPKHSILKAVFGDNFKPSPSNHFCFFRYNNILWSRIQKIEYEVFQGDVYDFNMKDNHNYLTDMGIVHNSGKRNGSIAVYIEPWHADIESFLDLRKNSGNHEERCHDLFTAMWVPDLFMKRIDANADWSLMCPDECPGLTSSYGEEFEKLYEKYESEGKYRKKVKAQTLFYSIMRSQIETGTPYMLYKDAVNIKSNQKNLGTIKSSNLCVASETMIMTDGGYKNIKEVAETNNGIANVWNGIQFSKVTVVKTGEMQKLLTVEFSNGLSLRCTPYHKFHIENNLIIEAKDLVSGMKIIKFNLPTIANGTATDLGVENKFIVPLNAEINTKLRWLEGYFRENKSIEFTSINFEFIRNIYYMLQTLGVNCGEIKNEGDFYYISIDDIGLNHLKSIGLSTKSTNINSSKTNDTTIKIKNVEDNNEYDDTYCFNEPLKHTGIFNGVIAGNCTEITLMSNREETAVCNLASIGLPTFVKDKTFNFAELHRVTQVITRNLNKVIDKTFYPTPETRTSNLRHRPIGIGIQGLANVFVLMGYPFESIDAIDLNKKIFATIYHAALTASVAISKKRSEMRIELDNPETIQERKEYIIKYLNMIPEEEYLGTSSLSGTYSSFVGSPASEGKLQYDMWGITEPETVNGFLDWNALKEEIKMYGLRNSTLLAPMPTATTSQILGFNESFEAFTSNIYQRQTLAGEFTIINKHLIDDLLKLGLWDIQMKDKILGGNGSVQHISEIPESIRSLYKTVWEIKQKIIIDQSADRAPYVCQSQSLNIHLEDPDFTKMTNVHFYGWKKGLKTGMYYLRSRNKAKITAFTLEATKFSEEEVQACRRDNPEGCVMCSG